MNCIIDTGGGNRGVFGAGVLERCLDENIIFDYCIGVSAGSANVVTYMAGQKGRLYRFYHDYSFRREYMSVNNLLKSGEYISLDYIYSTLSEQGGEDPLDYDAMCRYPGRAELVMTDGGTGEVRFFPAAEMGRSDYRVVKASCCIPLLCRPIVMDGRSWFDGGIAGPLPIDRAIEAGCDRIVVILPRPAFPRKNPSADSLAGLLMKKKNPAVSRLLSERIDNFNSALKRALELQEQGRCLIVAPVESFGVGMLTKTPEGMDKLYRSGYEAAGAIKQFLDCGD